MSHSQHQRQLHNLEQEHAGGYALFFFGDHGQTRVSAEFNGS
jgi:hypothetical protein